MPLNSTEDFRRQPPSPLAPRPLNIPNPRAFTLSNGLRMFVVEDRRLPLVSYRLSFPRGSARDPETLPGLTSMLANLITEGTTTRTSREIADQIARYGATLVASANSDFTTVAASSLSMYNDQTLDLMADVTLRPSFPQNELELTQVNTKQGLLQQRAQPSFLANERISRALFGRHPYATIAPTPESIDAMTREQLVKFHKAQFTPNGAVFIVAGDIEPEKLVRQAEHLFGDWRAGEPASREAPPPPQPASRVAYVVNRPGSEQSNIVIGNSAITRNNPDYFPMLVLHTILGANASSRLFMNLREEKGYTYGAYTDLDARRYAGSFRATAEVRTPVTGDSLKEFFYELERIREDLVPPKELSDAQAYLTGVFPIRLETQEGLINQLVQMKMYDLPDDYLHTYRERVASVTAEEVRRVARNNVRPDVASIVIVGDAAAIRDMVAAFASEVEFYDSTGQRDGGPVSNSADSTHPGAPA